MRFLTQALLAVLLCISSTTWALHESDVGIVDWHKKLIGVPLFGSTTTAPTFHKVGSKSIILTATGSNVLAALDAEDGSVAWRYLFEPEDRIAAFYKNKNVVASISGPGGSMLRTFDALTGSLILEKRLHAPELGRLSEPFYLGKAVAFVPNSPDLFVLTNGHTISYVDGDTGETKWAWTSPDHSSLVIYTKLIATADALYAIGLAKSTASYTLHVTSLTPSTGELIHSNNIPSSIVEPLTAFTMLTHPNASSPRVVWIEKDHVKSIGLVPKLDGKPISVKGSGYESIQDRGLGQHGQLIAKKTDGTGVVLKLHDDGATIKSVWEFSDSASSEKHTESIYAGGLDEKEQPYVARVYWVHDKKKGAADVFTSSIGVGGLAAGSFFPFDSRTHGIITHVALDPANPQQWNIVSRLVVTTSTGAVQLWDQGTLKWTREEALASLTVTEFVELPERILSESGKIGDVGEGFFERAVRQIKEAQDLPQYLVHFVKRFVTGSYASASSAATVPMSSSSGPVPLSRDTFGFRQVIVAATLFGKVYGIDSSNGDILWSRVLGLGWAAEVGGRVIPVKLYVTKAVSDGGDPEVVLVSQRRADNSLIDTVLFHLNAVTGEDVRGVSPAGEILEGYDIISGPIVESYFFQDETRMVILLDEFLQVHLYPDTPENQKAFSLVFDKLSFPLRTTAEGERRLTGHQVGFNPEVSDRFVAYATWTLSLPLEEDVQTILPASRGPIASLGKVQGNRTTLYKYLNPRQFVLLTTPKVVNAPCGIYVVDSMKGTIIYHAAVPSTSGGVCDVKALLTENWLVYHYYDDDSSNAVGAAKGYTMVSVEFYEGKAVNEKTKSSDLSAFSEAITDFTAYEQAYVFPHAITAIASTSTKFGITSKDIIVATKNHKIQSFTRQMLDPRRPHRKVTAEEVEEFLVQYDPLLPDNPQRVISHNYEVAKIQRIVTAPALLESTTLVFASGLDMFLTRVAPSNTFDVLNENFNKVQLVLTVTGLAIAIAITKPMVHRKRLREKWYQ